MIWSDLYQDILPHVPGCPEPLVEDAVKRVTVKFCRDSHSWKEQINDLYLIEGVDRYEIGIPEESELLEICELYFKNDTPLLDWPSINVFGLISFDRPVKPKEHPLVVKVVLVPSKDATGVPDKIGDHYREALIHGAIGILQEIPAKDWSNPQLAMYHKGEYQNGISEARSRAANGNTKRPMRVAPRFLL